MSEKKNHIGGGYMKLVEFVPTVNYATAEDVQRALPEIDPALITKEQLDQARKAIQTEYSDGKHVFSYDELRRLRQGFFILCNQICDQLNQPKYKFVITFPEDEQLHHKVSKSPARTR